MTLPACADAVAVAIVGSRDYPALHLVDAYVASLGPHDVVVSGGAPGVDRRAEDAARRRGLPEPRIFEARWHDAQGRLRKGAGFERNQWIVDACDELVAFWRTRGPRGPSGGTADTLRRALRSGKPLTVVDEDGRILSLDQIQALLAEVAARRTRHV